MNNREIWEIALAQSALDLNCRPEDLLSRQNVVVPSVARPGARKYLKLPFGCNLVSYGSNVTASVRPGLEGIVGRYLARRRPEECFETPAVHELDRLLAPHGLRSRYMAEYFLPDVEAVRPQPCPLEIRILKPAELAGLYLPQWSNALCFQRRETDMLAAAAYDGRRLAGMAGCSADCGAMWQIGIDVLPQYRRQGIAAALTSRLACEILERGKVPFYCAAWSNIGSVRNAIQSGFRPAWCELGCAPIETRASGRTSEKERGTIK